MPRTKQTPYKTLHARAMREWRNNYFQGRHKVHPDEREWAAEVTEVYEKKRALFEGIEKRLDAFVDKCYEEFYEVLEMEVPQEPRDPWGSVVQVGGPKARRKWKDGIEWKRQYEGVKAAMRRVKECKVALQDVDDFKKGSKAKKRQHQTKRKLFLRLHDAKHGDSKK